MALAAYACQPQQTRGRRMLEPAVLPPRNEHQRDRDRIVHSTAFRRLVYKTQVFINHEGDLYRTRLTHSLEVAQVGRSIARALALNEDLVEAIALAHDLGHTPFGHAGQDALHACMQAHGGFEHNLQSLRVVDELEARYPQFDGLNLTFEAREGILKHCSRVRAAALELAEPGGVAQRFIQGGQPSLEAQVVNLADEIAYNAHDVDDGVRSGLLHLEQLHEVPLLHAYLEEVEREHTGLGQRAPRRLLFECIRRMLSNQVHDVVAQTQARLQAQAPADVQAVRAAPPLVAFSERLRAETTDLKRFLFRELYRHPQVALATERARTVVAGLFARYLKEPALLPAFYANAADRHRAVADYIAGMTDRFAQREHHRLTGVDAFA